MASFGHYLKENFKKSFSALKDLNKRDLLRKSELNTLPKLAFAGAVLAGLVAYAFVPFALVATAVAASMVTGFTLGAAQKPQRMLEYTAIGSAIPFALPGAIAGGAVAAVQFGAMLAFKSVLDIRNAFKSAAKDKAQEQPVQAAPTPVAAPVETAIAPVSIPAPVAPAFTAAANENKAVVLAPVTQFPAAPKP